MALKRWMQFPAILDSSSFWPCLLVSGANLLNRPCGVLRDQWFRVGGGAFERWKVGSIAYVAERDANIAQEPAALYSFDRRVSKERPKLHVG